MARKHPWREAASMAEFGIALGAIHNERFHRHQLPIVSKGSSMIKSMSRADVARTSEDRDAIDRILERTKDLEQRTVGLTEALRSAYPHAAVYACALTQNGHRQGHAFNGSGVNSPSWTAEILDLAARAGNPKRSSGRPQILQCLAIPPGGHRPQEPTDRISP